MPPAPPTHDNKAGLYWAQRALEECDKASQEFAPDPVHDLRVAIRRCRSMADGFLSVDPESAWKEMKSLGKKEGKLKAAAQETLRNFDRKRWTALNARLARRASRVPLEGLVFQHLALERWMEAHELHRQALRNRTQVGYHQLRIGIKRFRYMCENFLPQR